MRRPHGPRFDEGHGYGLPLHDVPLKIENVANAISESIGNNQDTCSHG